MSREATPSVDEWTLPLRRRADLLFQQGRVQEAARILADIHRVFRGREFAVQKFRQTDREEIDQPQSVTWRKL